MIHARFRLAGEKLVLEYDREDGKTARITFGDILRIGGSGNIIFMNDTPDTFAESLVSAGFQHGVMFDATNRHLYFECKSIEVDLESDEQYVRLLGALSQHIYIASKNSIQEVG